MNPKSDNIQKTYSEATEILKESVEQFGFSQDVIDKVASYPIEKEKVDVEQLKEMVLLLNKMKDKTANKIIQLLEKEIELFNKELTIQNFLTLYECALEMRTRKENGEFKKYSHAYQFAVDHYTVDGKPIKHRSQLRKAYENAKDRGVLEKIDPRIKKDLR